MEFKDPISAQLPEIPVFAISITYAEKLFMKWLYQEIVALTLAYIPIYFKLMHTQFKLRSEHLKFQYVAQLPRIPVFPISITYAEKLFMKWLYDEVVALTMPYIPIYFKLMHT